MVSAGNVVALGGILAVPVLIDGSAPATRSPAIDDTTSAAATPNTAPSAFPLVVTDAKDGDSFVASDGVEYRVGLVNTPELGSCGGDEAAAVTADLLADGFAARAYTRDQYGRSVARIDTPQGELGILLARRGFADDQYLEDFRSENPAYAADLDDAFAAARRDRTGLYETCWDTTPVAQQPVIGPVEPGDGHGGRQGSWACHPAYAECLPDGPDLDCADVGHQVVLRGRDDPFRLDGNSLTATDGVGCDTYEPWREDLAYPYYG